MFYNYYQDYEYNSCVSRGICSIEPRTASLQEVIVMYLKQLSYYVLKLYEMGVTSVIIKEIIITTLSGLATSPNYTNDQFRNLIYQLENRLSDAMRLYEKLCNESNITANFIKSNISPSKIFNISKSIRQGEKEFLRKSKTIDLTQRSLYEVIFILIKSICINLITLKSYGKDDEKAYIAILELLNSLNDLTVTTDSLKSEISKFSEVDFTLLKRINELQSYNYGKQSKGEVSYSTRAGHAILVAGENVRELELILESTKDKEIDVYTHGDMILAYTFPKFREYKNLRGQFGTGIENFLLDFATFPGAILVAKHSLENIEYLYRGRLFTTDEHAPKGVVKIKDNDFNPLINSSLSAKGFKTGKHKPSVTIGYDIKELENRLDESLNNSNIYTDVIIAGAGAFTTEHKLYFEKLINNAGENVFIISLTYPAFKPNSIFVNATADFYFLYKITDMIREKNPDLRISLFLPKCDKHTISNIIKLKKKNADNIFLSKCSPLMMNPRILNTLSGEFKIRQISNAKSDLNLINNSKKKG